MRVKHGAIVVDSSGKSGGQFISKGRSGSVLRTVSNSVRKNSSSQLSQRARFRSVGSAWSALSSSQRQTWNAAALELRMSDGFGDDIHLSGFQLFKSYNQNLLSSGFSIVYNFGGLQSIAPMSSLSFVLSAYDQSLILTFAPVIPAGISFKVFASPVLSSGVSNYIGKFKKIADLSSSVVSGVDIGSEYVSVFGRVPDYAGSVWLYVVPMVVGTGQLGGVLSAYYSKPLQNTKLLGLSWGSLGQQFAQSAIATVSYVGSNIGVAGAGLGGLLLRSVDNGASWSNIGQLGSALEVLSFAVGSAGVVLAGTRLNAHIFRSVNYGLSWSDLGSQFGESEIKSMVSISDSVFLAGTSPNGLILRSNDYGLTWSSISLPFVPVEFTSLVHCSSGVSLAGSTSGAHILRSVDYGLTWSDLGSQFGQAAISSLVCLGGGIFLAGTNPSGKILRSVDYGLTWSDLGSQFGETIISSFAFFASGVVLAGTSPNAKILRSDDFGITWSDLGSQFGESIINGLAAFGSGVCVAGTSFGGLILRSTP